MYVVIPKEKRVEIKAAVRVLEGRGIAVSFLPALSRANCSSGEGLLALAEKVQDMGRTALTASRLGLHGAVLYEDRYLTTFSDGHFQTDEIQPADFAFPPFEKWGDRERLIWYMGLLLYANQKDASLLACMDEARKWARRQPVCPRHDLRSHNE